MTMENEMPSLPTLVTSALLIVDFLLVTVKSTVITDPHVVDISTSLGRTTLDPDVVQVAFDLVKSTVLSV